MLLIEPVWIGTLARRGLEFDVEFFSILYDFVIHKLSTVVRQEEYRRTKISYPVFHNSLYDNLFSLVCKYTGGAVPSNISVICNTSLPLITLMSTATVSLKSLARGYDTIGLRGARFKRLYTSLSLDALSTTPMTNLSIPASHNIFQLLA